MLLRVGQLRLGAACRARSPDSAATSARRARRSQRQRGMVCAGSLVRDVGRRDKGLTSYTSDALQSMPGVTAVGY